MSCFYPHQSGLVHEEEHFLAMDLDDDPTVHRLEASGPATGGLVIKKSTDSDASKFKVPKPSLLGLDRLAAQKRKEREDQNRLISFKDNDYDDDGASAAATPEHSAQKTPDNQSVHKLNRHYRESQNETPSHTGGVSEKARDRLAKLSEKEKRGVYVSTKDEKRSRLRDDNEGNFDRRGRDSGRRDRHRDYDRRKDRGRDYGRSRNDDSRRSHRSDRSDRSDRRKPSDSERSLHTPRFKDEPKTPNSSTATASTSWDDDDEKPVKRSSWDFPTPKDGDNKRSEWSMRSNSSSIYRMKKSIKMEDDTPRPTPAHRFNAWANDRKRSGATPHGSKQF